ncbi:MAG: ATP-binding cassette domain-containing protein [Pseudomonadota bacterium]
MHILRFLQKEIALPKTTLFVILTLSGMANSALLVVINTAADQIVRDGEPGQLFVLFVLLLSLFLYTQYYVLQQVVQAVEGGLRRVRQRLSEKIQQVSVPFAENHLRLGYVTTLTQDAATIAQGSLRLTTALQSLLVIVFSSVYLFVISPLSFMLLISFLAVLIPVFSLNSHRATQQLQQSHRTQAAITGKLADLLAGFKELRLNPGAREDFVQDIRNLIQDSARFKAQGNSQINIDFIFSNLARYLLLMLAVFVVPVVTWETTDMAHHVVATILFIVAPIALLTNGLPNLMRTESSLGNLYVLEAELDAAEQDVAGTQSQDCVSFRQITWRNVTFQHSMEDISPLLFGPVDMTLRAGETIFITGANGSGKSTLLKLLAGLYVPVKGELIWDDTVVDAGNIAEYRSLFATVFANNILFDQLYGIQANDKVAAAITDWLTDMQLQDKTTYQPDRHNFNVTQLSVGEQKRLNFIVSVLKQRPVLLLDELTADQQPQFRDYFYRRILPKLQAAGYTIVLVTHDEDYFGLADRTLVLQDKQIIR